MNTMLKPNQPKSLFFGTLLFKQMVNDGNGFKPMYEYVYECSGNATEY